MTKNIIIFKINRKLDFQNHLIGLDVYKNKRRPRSKNSDFIKNIAINFIKKFEENA